MPLEVELIQRYIFIQGSLEGLIEKEVYVIISYLHEFVNQGDVGESILMVFEVVDEFLVFSSIWEIYFSFLKLMDD